MENQRPIFAIVAPSGGGKTTLIERMLATFPDTLGVVRTVTTRSRRPEESEKDFSRHYELVTREDFEARRTAGSLIQAGGTSYAGQHYDNDRLEVNALLNKRFGICAWVEPTVRVFRDAGYHVYMIRIVPDGLGYANRSAERIAADRARAKSGPSADKIILNSFDSGGLENAILMLTDYLETEMARWLVKPRR